MILIGQLDSPYVRRVAVSMHLLGIPFERNPLSVFGNAGEVRRFNPLGRVPTLVLDDGEVVIESGAILDYLDELAGPERALLPSKGRERRRALWLMALATGADEKAVGLLYERRLRPRDMHFEPWLERIGGQLHSALGTLEAETGESWYLADRPTQADVTVATMLGFLKLSLPEELPEGRYPRLDGLSERAERLPAFQATVPPADERAPKPVD